MRQRLDLFGVLVLSCAAAVSGGIAPDLRYLERGDEMDEFFIGKVRNGVTRNGAVYMPPFEGMLTQEAMWAIRAWLETVHEEQ